MGAGLHWLVQARCPMHRAPRTLRMPRPSVRTPDATRPAPSRCIQHTAFPSRALDFLGVDAMSLVADQAKGMYISVSRSVTFTPGAPFVGSAVVTYGASVMERANAPAVELAASFAGMLQIDVLQNPLVAVQFGVSGVRAAGCAQPAAGRVLSICTLAARCASAPFDCVRPHT